MSPGFTMVDNGGVIDRLPEVDGTAVKVLLVLARHANPAGRCWPSLATICEKTGVKKRTAQYALRSLVPMGFITVEPRPGHATIYRLSRAPCCTPGDSGDATDCTGGVQPVAWEGGNQLHPEQYI